MESYQPILQHLVIHPQANLPPPPHHHLALAAAHQHLTLNRPQAPLQHHHRPLAVVPPPLPPRLLTTAEIASVEKYSMIQQINPPFHNHNHDLVHALIPLLNVVIIHLIQAALALHDRLPLHAMVMISLIHQVPVRRS